MSGGGKGNSKGRKGGPRTAQKNLRARRRTTGNKLIAVRKDIDLCKASGMTVTHKHMEFLLDREEFWSRNNSRGRGVMR